MELNRIIQGDCLEVMRDIPDKSVDMILCDLPYGTTACSWDTVIPFEPLWVQYKRIIKDNAAIVLFGSEPFSSYLRMSNIKWYKYDWKWDKIRGVGHLLAEKRPMMCTEDIIVFYNKQPTYNPIMRKRYKPRLSRNKGKNEVWNGNGKEFSGDLLYEKYPINLLSFTKSDSDNMKLHPTQKPVDLLIYLIETYTNEGELVMDNCAGSCSTAVACKRMGREFLMIEQDADYCEIGRKRLKQEYSLYDKL